MATIINPKLTIQENLPGGNVKATITCNVKFNEFEMTSMRLGLNRFRLECKLWEADWPDADDSIGVLFESKRFPDATPAAVESRVFEKTFSSSKLDKDFFEDEVYARLTLRELAHGTVVATAKTNEIAHSF